LPLIGHLNDDRSEHNILHVMQELKIEKEIQFIYSLLFCFFSAINTNSYCKSYTRLLHLQNFSRYVLYSLE